MVSENNELSMKGEKNGGKDENEGHLKKQIYYRNSDYE